VTGARLRGARRQAKEKGPDATKLRAQMHATDPGSWRAQQLSAEEEEAPPRAAPRRAAPRRAAPSGGS